MTFFGDVPRVLVFVPIGLLFFDVAYKTHVFKHLPFDTVADTSLAALTFSAIHLITRMLPESHTTGPGYASFIMAGVQFGVWPLTIMWSGRLERTKAGGLMLFWSYLVGGTWFAASTGLILEWTH